MTDLEGLTQNVSAAADLNNPVPYESELITVTGSMTGGPPGATPNLVPVRTSGVMTSDQLFLRFSASSIAALIPSAGCMFTATQVPLLRNGAQSQIAAHYPAQLSVTNCPAPRLIGAAVYSHNRVQLFFSSPMSPTSLSTSEMRLVGNGQSVPLSGTSVVGDKILLFTDPLVLRRNYTFTLLANGRAADVRGQPVDLRQDVPVSFLNDKCSSNALVLSQVYSGQGQGAGEEPDVIEILNRGSTDVNLAGRSIQYQGAQDGGWEVLPLPDMPLGGGQFFAALVGPQNTAEVIPVTGGFRFPGTPSIKTDYGAVALLPSVAPLTGCPTPAMAEEFFNLGVNNGADVHRLCAGLPGPLPLEPGGGPIVRVPTRPEEADQAACDDKDNTSNQDFQIPQLQMGPLLRTSHGVCSCFLEQ
jgi:hypothetical protein